MAEIEQLVVERRHIKQFADRPVDESELLCWLDAAAHAPNHRMTQPWEVIFVGPETRARLNHPANFGEAPVVMAVLSKAPELAMERDENLIATACFIQNFSLIAWSHGVGVRWTSIGWKASVHEALGVSDDWDVIVLGVGYPAEVPAPKPRTPMAEKVRTLP
ncbi:nitroreductase family protein [Alicyclobacillus contaminans]|uniref:nitroreductase family protein n=1 Tax=Alicyclobacillus contaminans TaxID=392016 RepID=UPI0004209898|nr:nitroreductase family protein [Alicyclobacillus contaminans]GMA49749.1 nitroreductase family protein [Alicyclobacillus contaminans]